MAAAKPVYFGAFLVTSQVLLPSALHTPPQLTLPTGLLPHGALLRACQPEAAAAWTCARVSEQGGAKVEGSQY